MEDQPQSLTLQSGLRNDNAIHPLAIDGHRNILLRLITRGSLVRGCVLSGAGAIAGGLIWCLAALITQMEFTYLAVGIGIAAGAGMLYGSKRTSVFRGVTAAGIATVGILLGRLLIVLYAIMPTIDYEMRKSDPRIVRLASHYGEIEGMYRGIHPRDEARYRLCNQRAGKLAELKDDELDHRIAELDRWESGGRDQDEEYVLHALAYCMIADDPAKIGYAQYRLFLIPEQKWPAAFEAARDRASALPAEQRLDALRDYRARNERYEKIASLALERADVRAVKERLPFSDNRRGAFEDEELAMLWEMSDQELQQAADEQAAWQRGKRWEDHRYLRNFVIYGIVKRRIEDRIAARRNEAKDNREEKEGFSYRPSEQDWEKLWAASAAEIHGKNEQELRAMADEIERMQQTKVRELEERNGNTTGIPSKSQRVAAMTPHILVDVIRELGVFGWVCILVAIILAYSIGAVETERVRP